MSIVTIPETCPQCHFEEGISDLHTSGAWETFFCPLCGYSAETQARLDAEGTFLTDASGKRLYETTQTPGHGAYYHRYRRHRVRYEESADYRSRLRLGEDTDDPFYEPPQIDAEGMVWEGGGGVAGALKADVTDAEIQQWIRDLEANPAFCRESSYITRARGRDIETLYGRGPSVPVEA